MNLKDIFNRNRPTTGTVGGTGEHGGEPAANQEPQTAAGAEPQASATPETALSLEDALRQLKSIRELLGSDEDDTLMVPCRALLLNLPEPLRGAKWQSAKLPEVQLELPRDTTLKQLRKGRISYPLSDFLPLLPEGWVQGDPAALVDFDLATVVQSIPPSWLRTTAAASKQVEAARHIPDYFKPAAPKAPAEPPPVVAAEPPPEPASAPAPEPRPLRPGEWGGVESARAVGARVVDINRATEADLQRLPNIGPLRARAIFHYRQAHGPFASIYDLTVVPGVGRKLFKQITGLTMRRKDRQQVLYGLLGLSNTTHPTLAELTQAIRDAFTATGCIISADDGIALTACGLPEDDVARYAALVPQLFRRARRYLTKLDPTASNCLALPSAELPLLCYRASATFLIVALPPGSSWDAALVKGQAIAREVDWLLSCRAVVRA